MAIAIDVGKLSPTSHPRVGSITIQKKTAVHGLVGVLPKYHLEEVDAVYEPTSVLRVKVVH